MHKILIVEDDAVIAGAIAKHIGTWGCEARVVADFANVLSEFTAFDPQLVLLDITLPFYNGFYWCRMIRNISSVPIIFLSSAADNMNIVMAMNMGGDDFIAKPFDLAVLTAKVQAMLRRAYDFGGQTDLIEHGGVILNRADEGVTVHGVRTDLTRNEFRILEVLVKNAGGIVSRDVLMQRLWETDDYIDENTLTVNVARLRRKLEAAGLPDFICTKKGSGYMIR